MRVRDNHSYVDAIKWRGDANYRQVCDFVGVTDQPGVADRRGIYLPGRSEQRAVPGDWVVSHYMVGGDRIALDGRGFARHYDQRGVSATGLADRPFQREGVARYRGRPHVVDAFHWSGDAAFGAVCELVGADPATADRASGPRGRTRGRTSAPATSPTTPRPTPVTPGARRGTDTPRGRR